MLSYRFIIANTKVLWVSDREERLSHLAPFIAEFSGECALLAQETAYKESEAKQLIRSEAEYLSWYQTENGYRLELSSPYLADPQDDSPSAKVYAAMDVDQQWRRATLSSKRKPDVCLLEGPLGEILVRNAALRYQGLQIHSAAIADAGRGIIFSAPSGTGKTTQAHLWTRHFGAKMLNGDRPIVCLTEHGPHVYGTAWSGSDEVYQNAALPLAAIVFIEQAEENHAERLTAASALKYLLPRCFVPYFSSSLQTAALNIVDGILRQTPCYLLRCKPERAAAELIRAQLGSSAAG
jgi:hypothetical protein